MSSDETNRGRVSSDDENPREAPPSVEETGPGPEMDRLPPPFFPPEERRPTDGSGSTAVEDEDGAEPEEPVVPDDPFVPPDEPIEEAEAEVPEDAFISPDDPIVPVDRDEEGKVTRLGDDEPDASPPPPPPPRSERPTIHELPYLLDGLAEKIHETGERAIRASPEKGHFESALCAFLRGYLTGAGD